MNFPELRFRGTLRPSQQDVVALARKQLGGGQRRLHIVAPPGSGKTVVGLYLWACLVRQPALVLSPNSAIQAQWQARIDLFESSSPAASAIAPAMPLTSTDPAAPGLLTSLTYQSVTLPRRGGDDLDRAATELWIERLIEGGQAEDPLEAEVWIADLRQHNPAYFEDRLSVYRKQFRDAAAVGGQAMDTLHQGALETLGRLRDAGVGLVILDECHHLLGHWGRVLADAHEFLAQPIVVGLTATPPDRTGKSAADVERYDAFFGPIDYEVPVPAVVKDGFLAPYQDLAYFVRPEGEELAFVAGADRALHELVEQLCQSRPLDTASTEATRPAEELPLQAEPTPPAAGPSKAADALPAERARPLVEWLQQALAERRLPTGPVAEWSDFERRDPAFANAARWFLMLRQLPLPPGVPDPDNALSLAEEALLDPAAGELPPAEVLVPVLDRYIRHALRRSPSRADHALAAQAIEKLRMLGVQITETGSRACASPVGRVMAYSSGKTRALLPILREERRVLGERIRAVVVTDYEKTSAVSAEVDHLLDAEAGGAVAAFRMLLSDPETDALDPVLVTGSSVLVDDDLAPHLLTRARQWLAERQHDVTLRLVEEQGFQLLLGQGAQWCPRVYVHLLTDLFQEGLTKCLVGTRGLLGEGWDANKINVLVDLTTVTTSMSVNQLRGRSFRLDPEEPEKLANNWDVVCVAPEFAKGLDDYDRFCRKHETIFGLTDDGAIEKGVGHVHAAFTALKPEGIERSAAALNDDMLRRIGRRAEVRQMWRIGEPYQGEPVQTLEVRSGPLGGGFPPFGRAAEPWSARSLTQAIGAAILGSLEETGRLRNRRSLYLSERAGGYVRIFLQQATAEENALFTTALQEALGPLAKPRYVIPRYVDQAHDTWLSSLLPEVVGQYFQRRRRQMVMLHAVPTVLAERKEQAEIYQRHWNRHVSPGQALYAHRGPGETLLREARLRKIIPRMSVHTKEVFLTQATASR